jgi:hypothetical protein
LDRSKFDVIAERGLKLSDFFAQKKENQLGWIAEYHNLERILSPETFQECRLDYKSAFASISFNEPIKAALEKADSVELPPNFTAIHLRAGDVVFGRWRKSGCFSEKVISLPIAKELIRLQKEQGRQVVLFGQDRQAIDCLAKSCGVLSSFDFSRLSNFSPEQQSIFDIKLASRAGTIIGGGNPTRNNESFGSGFSRLASFIGGATYECPFHHFTLERFTDVALRDLRRNERIYHPLQTAFAYWQAYHYGRQNRSEIESIQILEKAKSFDPVNPLYPLAIAALCFRVNQLDLGEQVLANFHDEVLQRGLNPGETVRQLYNDNQNQFAALAEYFSDLDRAAAKGAIFAERFTQYLSSIRGTIVDSN